MLLANEGKASRERLTLIRLFEELRGLGYDGGYDAVRRYGNNWRKEHGVSTAAAYVPLSFAPGEAYQFDWSHEVVLLSGVTVIVKAAHVRLCHSRMLFVRVYPRETQEMAGAVWYLWRRGSDWKDEARTISETELRDAGMAHWKDSPPKPPKNMDPAKREKMDKFRREYFSNI